MERDESIALILGFLDRIGIPYRETSLTAETFLPGVTIEQGMVHFDRARLVHPGDVLHEAGHIAVTPPGERAVLGQAVLDAQTENESLEVGVLLWTFLAAREMGLPVEVVFHAGGYKKGAGWLIEQFESGEPLGLPLLTWMGMAEPTPAGIHVKSWLRP